MACMRTNVTTQVIFLPVSEQTPSMEHIGINRHHYHSLMTNTLTFKKTASNCPVPGKKSEIFFVAVNTQNFFFLSQCNFSWHFQLCNRAANNFMRLQNCMFYEADKSLAVLANVCMYVQVNALKMMCCNILKVGQICSVFSVIITVMYYVA